MTAARPDDYNDVVRGKPVKIATRIEFTNQYGVDLKTIPEHVEVQILCSCGHWTWRAPYCGQCGGSLTDG